jgi:hypothetical protein
MMDDRVIGTPYTLVEASPIIVKSGCRPSRIVLCKKEDQFVTWEEMLFTDMPKEGPSGPSCKFLHHCFHQGGYHPFKTEARPFCSMTEQEALFNAQQEYKERVRKLFDIRD